MSTSASASASPSGSASASSPDATFGALELPHGLRHLFEALAQLEDGHSHDDVKILQYGDSHTASDFGTSAMRRALQARFGDGGRGFVALGSPWKKYRQDGVRAGMSKQFDSEKGKHVHGKLVGDGCYGLSGIAIASETRGATAWTSVADPASHIEIDYFEQPRGGTFDVDIDGARAGRITTRGATSQSAFFGFDVADGPHKVEISSLGDGDVRVFGMTLDRAEAGVVVDALGINGAQIFTPLSWSEAHMSEQLRHRQPDLVILAYGTNESMGDLSDAVYERSLVELLGRVARAVPGASCLLLGPPDRGEKTPDGVWRTSPKILAVIASQRRVARAAGCGFYDQLTAMGGEGTIATWATEEHPRAARDRVHLSREGYAQLAGSLVEDMMHAYGVWRSDMGLVPTGPQGGGSAH